MATLSNRVSLDTNVLFIRNALMYSTMYIPVSTNFITAVGSNGHIITSNILENISTYGVGYLPDVFSTIDGNIISVSKTYLQSQVNMNELSIMTAAISSQISTTKEIIDSFSTYTITDFIPSTVSTVESTITGVYTVTNQIGKINQTQFMSTNIGLSNYISSQTEYNTLIAFSTINSSNDYLQTSYLSLSSFSNYSTSLMNIYADMYSLINNTYIEYESLSTYTYYAYLFFQSTNTILNSNFNYLTLPNINDPNTVIGYLSTANTVTLPSNIEIQTINNVLHNPVGIRCVPSTNYGLSLEGEVHNNGQLNLTNSIVKTLFRPATNDRPTGYYAQQIYINGTNNNNIHIQDTNNLVIETLYDNNTQSPYFQLEQPNCKVKTIYKCGTIQQLHTLIGPNAENLAISVASTFSRVAIKKEVSPETDYILDISGNLNLSGIIYQNGVPYDMTGGSADVLGILASTQNVYILSTIFIKSMNTIGGNVGINCIPTKILDINGNVSASNTINFAGNINTTGTGINTFALSSFTNTIPFSIISETNNTILACIPSTNNIVTINCSNTQSNYQLEVNGPIRATGAIIANRPLIWSYSFNNNNNTTGTDTDYFVRFTTSNYQAPNTNPLITSNNYTTNYTDYGGNNINQLITANFSVFVTPYNGLYSITVNAIIGIHFAEYGEIILYDINANTPIYISHLRPAFGLDDTDFPVKFTYLSYFSQNSKFSVIHHKEPNKGNNYSSSSNVSINIRYLGET